VPPVPDGHDGAGTGYRADSASPKPQVNDRGTGGTGQTPFKATNDDSARLFDPDPVPGDDEVRHCGCGNELTTTQARAASKCKPCRDKAMEGYDR
jgi:hypothetical protein